MCGGRRNRLKECAKKKKKMGEEKCKVRKYMMKERREESIDI